MIRNMKLKFGATATSAPLEVEITPITVFVGPNNSGKSKILSEIHGFCRGGNSTFSKIVEDIEFKGVEDFEAALSKIRMPASVNQLLKDDEVIIGNNSSTRYTNKKSLKSLFTYHVERKSEYAETYISLLTLALDGRNRLDLINEQQAGDLLAYPSNHLMALMQDPNKRAKIRRIIHDAFKMYFVVNATNLGKLNIRFSQVEPESEEQECGVQLSAINFQSKATPIEQLSDGVKAFTAIITMVIAGDPEIIIIDEPEAFLHPSLSLDLGKEVGKNVGEAHKNLFVSTHSSHFLMGCIQSGTPINIVRLTHSNETSTARLLPSSEVLNLFRHPLLRSTGVLNALFYNYVIVTEADADRCLYQEINERLLSHSNGRGIANCLFLNAQNKQTIHEIMKPLRLMGIPCAAIVDVDVIKEGELFGPT
ncbi:MAG: ATP-dependent nuclease [Agriterribacter sp.]